jgi:serine carboxypeptidase-like clade 1
MISRLFFLSALLLSCLLAVQITADVPADLIDTIPGYGKSPSKQYSGFLPADDAQTIFLHYWFVTSTGNPSTDPVVVWMNGGPGCSSLEGGLYELGPFTFTGKTDSSGLPSLVLNPNAWTTVANVLFLEQPAGVGFSYATNGSTTSDDYIQSQNTYGFLLSFFKAYPEFTKNEFFITGESYAGVYVPTLAYRVYEGNMAGKPFINIKGAAIGNGCWGDEVGTCSGAPDSQRIALTFFHGHGMISQPMWDALISECGPAFNSSSDKCATLIDNANTAVGNIDVYDVYDTCNDGLAPSPPTLRAPSGYWLDRADDLGDAVQCLNAELGRQYFDSPVVRKAWHVDQVKLDHWTTCYNIDYSSTIPDERPMYHTLIANMRILIYNGDADACVPWVGNEEWTRSMGYPVTEAWRPWDVKAAGREWVGGFVTEYGKNFTFLTIKHAGHMVRHNTHTHSLSAVFPFSPRALTHICAAVLCDVFFRCHSTSRRLRSRSSAIS